MYRRIAIALLACLALLGVTAAPAAATSPAPAAVVAGNGTNNFYLTGSCGINMPLGTWASLSFTNYDNGANQVVHTNIRRSGVGIQVQVWINGVFIEAGDLEDYYAVQGHSRVNVMLRARPATGGNWYSCSDTA